MGKLPRWSLMLLHKETQQKCQTDEIRNDKAVLRDKQMFKRQILITMRKGTLAKYDFREQ